MDIDTGTFKLILLTASYTPSQDTHNFRDDLGANEATGGTGYPAGGFTIVPTFVQSTNTINWDTGDISQAITGGPFAFRYGAIAKILGGASSADPLVGFADFGSQSITDATLQVQMTNPLTVVVS